MKKQKGATKSSKPRERRYYYKWKSALNGLRNEDGKIGWGEFALCSQRIGHAWKFGTPEEKILIGAAMGKSSIRVMFENDVIDVVKIQPIKDSEPILCFTKTYVTHENGRAVVKDYPMLTLWKGYRNDEMALSVAPNAFKIPLYLIADAMLFRSDLSPLKEAIPRLRSLGFMRNGRGQDQREELEKNMDELISCYCRRYLLEKNDLPSAKEVAEILSAERILPDTVTIERTFDRIISAVIEDVTLSDWRARRNEELTSTK